MTKITVNPGVCGMECTVEVSKIDRMNFNVKIDTKCEMVNKLGEKIAELSLRDVLTKYGQSKLIEESAGTLAHAACPIPTAITKAVEAEAGMALPRDVTITFVKE